MKFIFAVMFSLAALTASANEGISEKHPCKTDREKFCGSVERGEGRIAKCMMENKDKLSSECQAKMTERKETREERRAERKEKRKAMFDSCRDDVKKVCGEMKPGEGRIMECLRSKEAELSAPCKASLSALPHKK